MSDRKMSIQDVVEKILAKHKINSEAETYYLKLKKSAYMDLIIERQGPEIFVGHYRKQNGDLISDPVLVMDSNGGHWFPVRVEQVFGDSVCSYMQDGIRMIAKKRIAEFKSFQAMFARNIRDQGWLDVKESYREP